MDQDRFPMTGAVQPDTGIGAGILSGFESGLQSLLARKLDETKRNRGIAEDAKRYEAAGLPPEWAALPLGMQQLLFKQATEKPKQSAPLTPPDFAKYLKAVGYTNADLYALDYEDLVQGAQYAQMLSEQIGPERALEAAAARMLGDGSGYDPEASNEMNIMQAAQPKTGIREAFAKGTQSSTIGQLEALLKGIPESEYQKQIELQNPGFLASLASQAGHYAGNLPAYLVGGQVGGTAGAAGGPVVAGVGATAGAFGLEAALKTGMREYAQYKEKGGKGSFEDFVNSAARTTGEGIKGAALGAIFGTLKVALPILKAASPKLANLIEKGVTGKVLDKAIDAALLTSGLVGAESLAEGRVPTSKEIGHTFVQVLGFELTSLSPAKRAAVEKGAKNSGKPPEQFFKEVVEDVTSRGKDPKNSNEIVRSVKRLETKGGKASEAFAKAEKPEISKEKLEQRERASRETEQKLRVSPVEEYLKREKEEEQRRQKPPRPERATQKETAKADLEKFQKQRTTAREDIQAIDETLASKKKGVDRPLLENVKTAKEREIAHLEEKISEARDRYRYGFDIRKTEMGSQARLKELEKLAKDPKSQAADDMQRMFKEDQKHVARAEMLANRGQLPKVEVMDRAIKELSTYQKAYRSLLEDVNSKLKNPPKGQVRELNRLAKLLEQNLEINESKLAMQRDKHNVLAQLNKPGGALVKQRLKSLRQDMGTMQKDFIKAKKEFDAVDQKIRQATTSKYPDLAAASKLVTQASKNPTGAAVEKLGEAAGLSKEQVGKARQEASKAMNEVNDKVKAGASDQEIGKALKGAVENIEGTLKGALKGAPKRVGTMLKSGLKVALLQVALRSIGINIPHSALRQVAGVSLTGAGAYAGFSLIKGAYRKIANAMRRHHFKTLTSPREKLAYRKKLKSKGVAQKDIDSVTRSR